MDEDVMLALAGGFGYLVGLIAGLMINEHCGGEK